MLIYRVDKRKCATFFVHAMHAQPPKGSLAQRGEGRGGRALRACAEHGGRPAGGIIGSTRLLIVPKGGLPRQRGARHMRRQPAAGPSLFSHHGTRRHTARPPLCLRT